MSKSAKVKIMIIIICLSLSAIIMSYKYFTRFEQTQIDKQEEEEANAWDSPINQFEFANFENKEYSTDIHQDGEALSKIDTTTPPQAFLEISYSTTPFFNIENAEEFAKEIASVGKNAVIQDFMKDMKNALNEDGIDFSTMPSLEDFQKKISSTQTQKILLQYSRDPAFKEAMQTAMENPAFATGFLNFIQEQSEQENSK